MNKYNNSPIWYNKRNGAMCNRPSDILRRSDWDNYDHFPSRFEYDVFRRLCYFFPGRVTHYHSIGLKPATTDYAASSWVVDFKVQAHRLFYVEAKGVLDMNFKSKIALLEHFNKRAYDNTWIIHLASKTGGKPTPLEKFFKRKKMFKRLIDFETMTEVSFDA